MKYKLKKFQKDLDKLYSWSKLWKMEFNLEKFKRMHISYRNKNFNYHFGETQQNLKRIFV